MRALTVRQPWAGLIALGYKRIETRSWPAPRTVIGRRIAIHAGMQPIADWSPVTHWGHVTADWEAVYGNVHSKEYPLGQIIATAHLVGSVPIVPLRALNLEEPALVRRQTELALYFGGVVSAVSDQFPLGRYDLGSWAWLLGDVERVEDGAALRGALGFWETTEPPGDPQPGGSEPDDESVHAEA